jgi:hypothetical protein
MCRLNEDRDLAKPRIQAVTQGEINDAIFAAEGDGWLGTVLREGIKPFPFAARQDHSHQVVHHNDLLTR